jgi:hypothetical protein
MTADTAPQGDFFPLDPELFSEEPVPLSDRQLVLLKRLFSTSALYSAPAPPDADDSRHVGVAAPAARGPQGDVHEAVDDPPADGDI